MSKEQLKEIKKRLEEAFGQRLKGVVLYGSVARGSAGPDSDMDILILLEGPVKYGEDLRTGIHATYPLVLRWDRPISVEPVDIVEYEKREWPLYDHARQEGVMA